MFSGLLKPGTGALKPGSLCKVDYIKVPSNMKVTSYRANDVSGDAAWVGMFVAGNLVEIYGPNTETTLFENNGVCGFKFEYT
jgi:hypothetical protein